MMRATETATVVASPDSVFPLVADLARYPSWNPLVHTASPIRGGGDRSAWDVEIRARVGPFARSKRLRMERTECEPDRLVVFRRVEVDGRQHADWVLRVELDPHPTSEGTDVVMHLAYDGSFWSSGPLARVFDDQVRRARDGLIAAVASASA